MNHSTFQFQLRWTRGQVVKDEVCEKVRTVSGQRCKRLFLLLFQVAR